MIVTTLDKLTDYKEIPYAEDIQQFICDFKKSHMNPGRYDIHGDSLFAAVSRYDTQPMQEREFENHRKYIDLQIVLDGKEKLYWAPVETLTMTKDGFSDGGDISFYKGEALSSVTLGGEQCAVLFENDAHMPNCNFENVESVIKVVFKILP